MSYQTQKFIYIKGARVHNLKNISVKIPRNKLTVITGISGSGKSSLAFDTIFAEGQRRYVESLSLFARQFLGALDKPDVDNISGLSPTLAIDQKTSIRSPRSTVGTMSEVSDWLRLLYVAIGKPNCPQCKKTMVPLKKKHGEKSANQAFVWRCQQCEVKFPKIELATFSFNSPEGACSACHGLGHRLIVSPKKVFPNPRLTIAEGAIRPWQRFNSASNLYQNKLAEIAKRYNFSLNTPVRKLSKQAKQIILWGDANLNYQGVIPSLEQKYATTNSEYLRKEIGSFMVMKICDNCQGKRLCQRSLCVKVGDFDIFDIGALTIDELANQIRQLLLGKKITGRDRALSQEITRGLSKRLKYLKEVGLGYLSINRSAPTLSGGEAQRIRLASQLGSGLTGVIYILDEPSIGLHPRNHNKLLKSLDKLKLLGNTVIVVEHDEATINFADWIIDVGPKAGESGGKIVAQGTIANIKKSSSITAQYLTGKKRISYPAERRKSREFLSVKGASAFNLKNLSVKIPLGVFTCVTGVSGSGKSTLVHDIISRKLAQIYFRSQKPPARHLAISGHQHLKKVITVNQSPIGRNARSNPATYCGIFSHLRQVYAQLPEARALKLTPASFSFNLKGGRCPKCKGEGLLKFQMYFLPNFFIKCEDCKGKRYRKKIQKIKFKNYSIADTLDLTVNQASKIFSFHKEIRRKLSILRNVGLGYIRLGQPAPNLSGGEAQRIKLATELSRTSRGKTLYILDEPTAGLHFDDIKKLLAVIHKLVDKGNSVLVVEHNLDVIKNADWIIDLGPEGGDRGGYVVGEGTPEQLVKNPRSETGKYLSKVI